MRMRAKFDYMKSTFVCVTNKSTKRLPSILIVFEEDTKGLYQHSESIT